MPKFLMREKKGKHTYLYPQQNEKGRRKKRVLYPGDIIDCSEYEIAGALDKFECLEPEKLELERNPKPNVGLKAVEVEEKEIVNYIKKRVGKGQFDVINEVSGLALNEGPLTKQEANQLVEKATK